MSHFLWIEDFDGDSVERLSRNAFSEILSEVYNTEQPNRTNNVLVNQLNYHGIYIKRNFEEALNYIRKNLSNIDYIIIDINLPAKNIESDVVKEFLRKFYEYKDNEDGTINSELLNEKYKKFRLNSGFYLFTELVCEFSFPKKHIRFYSNHGNDQDIIKNKFKEAGITLPDIYVKGKKEDKEIRKWVKDCYENPYSRLRRGIIKACSVLEKIAGDENNLQINDYAKDKISSTDIINYLDTLSQLLPISEPVDLNLTYRIFLRTLAHEWDICSINPQEDWKTEKYSTSTFVQTMMMVRNWVAHDKLLEQYYGTDDRLLKQLNEEIISFLFIVNMRAMFKLENSKQKYEVKLLNCISKKPVSGFDELDINNAEKYLNDLLKNTKDIIFCSKNRVFYDSNELIFNKNTEKKEPLRLIHFNQKINCLYKKKQIINLKYCYQQLLLQYFFVSHLKNRSDWLKNIATEESFLPTLAQHIYSRSFSKD